MFPSKYYNTISLKSINIWKSYSKNKGVPIFWNTVKFEDNSVKISTWLGSQQNRCARKTNVEL